MEAKGSSQKEILTIPITSAKVGSIIHYITSKKLYLVTDVKNGYTPERLLSSTTQKYRSIKKFDVIEVIAGTGELTEDIANQIEDLVKSDKFKSEKRNQSFPQLYKDEWKRQLEL